MGKWWFCGVACAVVVLSVSVICGVTATTADSPSAKTAVTAAKDVAVFGTLGVFEGHLALFCDGDTPKEVYDVWVAALPPEEQARLAKGIPAATREAFLALLQEYTG